jgi:hypothetical protein
MSNTITTTVFYRMLKVGGWKSSIAKFPHLSSE